ncbi:MAG: GNAT family acetyltransferase [Bacillota bacterium]
MIYRNATIEDIPQISELQKKYHVSTISEEDKSDGFVTTLFTPEKFGELIEKEQGIVLACDGDKVIAYAMAASWEYWSEWPLFQHMIKDLPDTEYMDETLSTENSYQYGPICIDKNYRSTEVLPKLFDFSREQMNKRFPILITFINHINPRSYKAHVDKLGLDVIKDFQFNNNNYYELGYDTSKPVKGL